MSTQTLDAALEALLASVQDEYEKADRDWKPEPGDYLCLLGALNIGSFRKDGVPDPVLTVSPDFVILGGQLDGRSFRERFTNQSPMSTRFMRQFVESCLKADEYGLEPSGVVRDDLVTLKSLEGRLIVVVRTTRSKKDPKYINASVVRVESVQEESTAA